ncbi:hypothetical protein AVDCRST_MAG94-4773 [uncultured Leptolyngbya sp.]|uniref:Uncharacterized protein n=1 Tax=uncultured Leptolyngbya sp. TaxID=332963 RepID=A0A6J4N9Z5_9CYAN|nr:hypothetical protein AVDCRST_MAG94-4773 [uncultured Leptolyngbya sp.]
MTCYIGIFATKIAIVTPDIMNVSQCVGIATGQLRSVRVK